MGGVLWLGIQRWSRGITRLCLCETVMELGFKKGATGIVQVLVSSRRHICTLVAFGSVLYQTS